MDSSISIIDQFKSLVIHIPASLINKVKRRSSYHPLIDISNIIPTESSLDHLAPSLTSVAVSVSSTKETTLNIESSLTFTNPVNVSLKIPYLKLDIGIENNPAITLDINNLDLKRGRGVSITQTWDTVS